MRVLIFVLLLSLSALAQPSGSDTVHQAVERLQQAGLLKGYPDGKMAGSRAMTRYEVVELLDRFTRLYEDATRNFVTKTDLEPVRQAVQAVRDTMSELEARVGPLEDAVERNTRILDH